jgi:hypothetical protein
MFEDPLFWILVLPGLLLGVYAQSRIKINIAKYSHVTGGQVVRQGRPRSLSETIKNLLCNNSTAISGLMPGSLLDSPRRQSLAAWAALS